MPITTIVLSTKYKEGSSSAMQINVRFFMLVTLSIEKKGDTNAWFCCILDRRYCCSQKGNVISNHCSQKALVKICRCLQLKVLKPKLNLNPNNLGRKYPVPRYFGPNYFGSSYTICFSSKIQCFKKSSSPPSLTLSFSHLIILSFPASWFLN